MTMMEDGMLLRVEGLRVHFRMPKPHLLRMPKPHLLARAPMLWAVDGVGFQVARGRTFGLVGESGCGKTTTAMAVLRLVEPTRGSIWFDGTDITHLDERQMRPFRRRMQIIFQDPYSSLNPRWTAGQIIAAPLKIHGVCKGPQRDKWVSELLERVGLRPEMARAYPHQLSGGQRQRVAIARALALSPDLVVCDDPVSALDVAIQAQILNLLVRLQEDLGLTYLFISHDMAVIQHMCDEIGVMYLGKLVEMAHRRSLFMEPIHPYTQALLSAVPTLDPEAKRLSRRMGLSGDPPSPLSPPAGCRFHTRCHMCQGICKKQEPELREVVPGHWVACHVFC
jgi:oligopeptide/dipeptide ABC transporter ATP-binding protein